MQIEAIYDHGYLEFTRPVLLKHDRIRIVVEVPDEELVDSTPSTPDMQQPTYELPPEVVLMAKRAEEKLDQILNVPLPDDADLPPLTRKQLDRIEAIALRDQIRDGR